MNRLNSFVLFGIITLFAGVSMFALPAKASARDLVHLDQDADLPVAQYLSVQADHASLALMTNLAQQKIPLSVFAHFPVNEDNYYGISTKFSGKHRGIDFRAALGSNVYAIRAGKVSAIEFEVGGYGRYVMIDHGNGLQSLYAHLSKTSVKLGQEIDQDTVIGAVGLTGHTTGPHVHFEVHGNGVQIDPTGLLPKPSPVNKV